MRKGTAASRSTEPIPEFVTVGSLRIGKIVSPEHGIVFEPGPLEDGQHCIIFVLQLIGTATCEQHRRAAQLAPGQWDAFEAAPLTLTAHRGIAEHVAMLVP